MRVEKTRIVLICLLFALTVLYPAGIMIATCFGFSFVIIRVLYFSVAIAALSMCIVVLDLISKSLLENNTIRFLLAIITPFSLLSALFCILECPQFWVIASVAISIVCCIYLTFKYGKPLSLKTITLILSSLMIFPIVSFSFIALVFGNIAQNSVIQTVDSPSGKYYAQVINSDQGALGGNTLVDVYQDNGINMLIFKIEKKPQRVYFGDWREFENMYIHWKNDNCLVINSVEYEIKFQ